MYMNKFAEFINKIEIDSLWTGGKHISWNLDRKVNILSGINGVGKSTILNKVIKELSNDNGTIDYNKKGVKISLTPDTATKIRFDIIRSFDRPLLYAEKVNKSKTSIATELDWQLFQLQRKYLDYQVNIGNKMIKILQTLKPESAKEAQALSLPKTTFQNIIDNLFKETGKELIRSENEIRFKQGSDILEPYNLSSGEKQILAILLTVLVEDNKPYVLLMDEPEVSLHIEWQKQLIDLILELNPNVQIILTTHSPAVIMNGWVDSVTEVNEIASEDNINLVK